MNRLKVALTDCSVGAFQRHYGNPLPSILVRDFGTVQGLWKETACASVLITLLKHRKVGIVDSETVSRQIVRAFVDKLKSYDLGDYAHFVNALDSYLLCILTAESLRAFNGDLAIIWSEARDRVGGAGADVERKAYVEAKRRYYALETVRELYYAALSGALSHCISAAYAAALFMVMDALSGVDLDMLEPGGQRSLHNQASKEVATLLRNVFDVAWEQGWG